MWFVHWFGTRRWNVQILSPQPLQVGFGTTQRHGWRRTQALKAAPQPSNGSRRADTPAPGKNSSGPPSPSHQLLHEYNRDVLYDKVRKQPIWVTVRKPARETFPELPPPVGAVGPHSAQEPDQSPPYPETAYGSQCPGPWSWPRIRS
jgi:hypothetical protein